jgi:hypothetical protein
MDVPDSATDRSWFRSRGGRRFAREFAAVVILKLLALLLIWFVCIRPQPRADTTAPAVATHLLAPATEAAQ